jgi:predicted MFS family arabinose efflux permease
LVFVTAATIDALGTGLYLTIYATFATHIIGLSMAQAGAVLSAAGLVALLGALPLVALLDRVRPHKLLTGLYLARALGYAVIACREQRVDRVPVPGHS